MNTEYLNKKIKNVALTDLSCKQKLDVLFIGHWAYLSLEIFKTSCKLVLYYVFVAPLQLHQIHYLFD